MTSIEWTDRTWNPVRGCSRVSEGCRNCYAERIAARFAVKRDATGPSDGPFAGFVRVTDSGPRWTGKVELVESKLTEPLHWRKRCRIFVNSMSDLFHEALPDEAIDRVFAVMALCPQHKFQVLTKRADRMRAYIKQKEIQERIGNEAAKIDDSMGFPQDWDYFDLPAWPMHNVWLGVSVEDQKTADERIPLLLQTPAAVRFVSYEPALGPVDFTRLVVGRNGMTGQAVRTWDALRGCSTVHDPVFGAGGVAPAKLDWIIIGGESGPEARPFDIENARCTIAQCKAAGVACFVKQLGSNRTSSLPDAPTYRDQWLIDVKDKKGGDPAEWSWDLRVREYPCP